MRLEERNDLRESEDQQVARHVDRLKLQIRDKIGVNVLRSLNEAKNMALRAELMLQEVNNRFDGDNGRFGAENLSRSVVEEKQRESNEKREDKAVGKQPIEVKNVQKQSNPYAKPILGKYYRCSQPGHRSNEYPNRKSVNIAEKSDKIFYEPNGDDEYFGKEDGKLEQTSVIKKLKMAPEQKEDTQQHQLGVQDKASYFESKS